MHRPFYVLFVLLQTLASFLFLVRSLRAENPELTWVEGRGGVLIVAWQVEVPVGDDDLCGWYDGIDDPPVLGGAVESEEAGKEAGEEEIEVDGQEVAGPVTEEPGDSVVDGTADSGYRLPWCAADAGGSSAMELLGTGYDGDYDFAMFGGRYLDIAPSHSTVGEVSSRAVIVLAGSGTSLYYEDADGCLHGGSVLPAAICPAAGDAEVNVNRARASTTTEAEGWREALASYAEVRARLIDAQEAWQSLVGAAKQTGDAANGVWVSLWRAPTVVVEKVAPEALVVAPEAEPTAPVSRGLIHNMGIDYSEEVALMNAAYTLDQISLRLQEMAQYLRYMAADRIVEKGSSRRVAQRVD